MKTIGTIQNGEEQCGSVSSSVLECMDGARRKSCEWGELEGCYEGDLNRCRTYLERCVDDNQCCGGDCHGSLHFCKL